MTLATAPGTPRRVSKPNLRTFTSPPTALGPTPLRISPARPFPPKIVGLGTGIYFLGGPNRPNRLELSRPG